MSVPMLAPSLQTMFFFFFCLLICLIIFELIFGHDVLLGTSCCCKQAVGNEAERCGAGPPSEPVFPEHELYKCFSVCFFFPSEIGQELGMSPPEGHFGSDKTPAV